ncbi:MAG: hypothetical protein ACYCO3_12180 [Mycobacteriales bacterium]
MTVATTAAAAPARHALVRDCGCGLCPPTWAGRRGKSRRFSQPVTLLAALEAEDTGCWAGMVESHRQSLSDLVCALDESAAAFGDDDGLGNPMAGSELALFAGELASVLRDPDLRGCLPVGLVSDSERTVSDAMVTVAGCLSGALAAATLLSGTLLSETLLSETLLSELVDEPPF